MLVLIYVLIVGWFRSFLIPVIIMAPIPLTLIGILPGHWVTGSFFTATSMIGFIALAGIIVRNSILLVDFIQMREKEGGTLTEAVLEAGAVRFRPIVLTAAALIVGALVIRPGFEKLLDPFEPSPPFVRIGKKDHLAQTRLASFQVIDRFKEKFYPGEAFVVEIAFLFATRIFMPDG